MSREVVAAVGVLVLSLLAGCDGGGQEPAGLTTVTASPTATEPTPTPTPTPTGPVDRSDEEVGIVFEDLPDVTGDALTALDTLTLFEVEEWRAMTTGAIDSDIAFFVAPEVVDLVQAQLDGNVEGGWTVDGVLTVTVQAIDADAHTAHATVCRDDGSALYTDASGTYTPAELDLPDALLFNAVLSRIDETSPWMLESYDGAGTC